MDRYRTLVLIVYPDCFVNKECPVWHGGEWCRVNVVNIIFCDCSYHLTIPPRQDHFSLEEAGDRLGTAVLWRSWTMMIKSSWKDLSRATVRGAGVRIWFETQTNSKL